MLYNAKLKKEVNKIMTMVIKNSKTVEQMMNAPNDSFINDFEIDREET